jgi:hypothetical protein
MAKKGVKTAVGVKEALTEGKSRELIQMQVVS